MPKKVEFIPNPYMGENKGSVNHHAYIAYQNAEIVTSLDEAGETVTSIATEAQNRQMRAYLYEGLTIEQCLWRAQLQDNGMEIPDALKTPDELAPPEEEVTIEPVEGEEE